MPKMKLKDFLAAWVNMLWRAMHKTQRGLRLNSLGYTGRGGDRREDKLQDVRPAFHRRYAQRYGR